MGEPTVTEEENGGSLLLETLRGLAQHADAVNQSVRELAGLAGSGSPVPQALMLIASLQAFTAASWALAREREEARSAEILAELRGIRQALEEARSAIRPFAPEVRDAG